MGMAMTCLWVYAVKNGLTISGSGNVEKATCKLFIFAAILSAAIFIMTFISFYASMFLFVVMFLIFASPKDRVGRIVKMAEHPVLGKVVKLT